MSEKMLVTQALDERDLLVKKISDKIDKASIGQMELVMAICAQNLKFRNWSWMIITFFNFNTNFTTKGARLDA